MDDYHCAYCGRTHSTASCPLVWSDDNVTGLDPSPSRAPRYGKPANRAISALCLLALMTGCTDEPATYRALKGAGYTEVQITGYSAFGCSNSDDFATGFIARGPTGQAVSGVVCSGVLKGATIRTN